MPNVEIEGARMIPQLLLEEIILGEKKESDYYDRYGKPALEKALSELKQTDEKILSSYPAEKILEKINGAKKSSAVLELPKKKTFTSAWKYCAAALLLFALALPLAMHNLHTSPASSSVRVKGNARQQIRLYRQKGDDAVLLKNGESASESDLIQITYTSGSYNYGVIFSVDGNGSLTRHFPENSLKAAVLEKSGEEVPLSFSYALDNAPEYECFVFVASKNPFDLSALENIEQKKYSIDFLKNGSYLPKDCERTVFVLKKK